MEIMFDAETSQSSASPGPVDSTNTTSLPPAESSGFAEHEVIARRERSIIDGILTNESLTSELDDEDAQEMIDWSISIGKNVARKTASLDESRAERMISECMYANRKMMRNVKRLVVECKQMDETSQAQLLAQIHEQARAIYGDEAVMSRAGSGLPDGKIDAPRSEDWRVVHVRKLLDPHLNR